MASPTPTSTVTYFSVFNFIWSIFGQAILRGLHFESDYSDDFIWTPDFEDFIEDTWRHTSVLVFVFILLKMPIEASELSSWLNIDWPIFIIRVIIRIKLFVALQGNGVILKIIFRKLLYLP